MKITDITIRRIAHEGKMRAIVSVTFNKQLVVHDMKVIEGRNGIFVAMPSRQMKNGEYIDISHPITMELRKKIEKEILLKYNEVISKTRAE